MNELIDLLLQDRVQEFILSHENADASKLLLKQKAVDRVPIEWVVNQIHGRKKSKTKIPLWYTTKGIIYPAKSSLEQSTSQAVAQFKGTFIAVLSRELNSRLSRGADITGGYGVDTYFLKGPRIDYVECDKLLHDIARHNHGILGSRRIQHFHAEAQDYLAELKDSLDFIYVDPLRRSDARKVFKLSESLPNVVNLQSLLLEKAPLVFIKASPWMDLQQGIRELNHVSQILVIALDDECKEVLFVLKRGFSGIPVIRAVGLQRDGEDFGAYSFTLEDEKNAKVRFSEPIKYLYEPNVALLKAGAFKWISESEKVSKLAPDTHFYTSDKIVYHFPGKIFRIIERTKLDKKLKARFPKGQANILVRNYPSSVEEIKKKSGLTEGGELFLICTRSQHEKHVLVAERIRLFTSK